MYTTRFVRLLAALAIFIVARAALGDPLTVSAAISLKDALTDAGKAFEQKTGDHLTFNFLASGPLMKQIEEGAPVDVFMSAARKQMDELRASHLIDAATERVVARGELVLIVPAEEKDPPTTFLELAGPKCKRLAIGEPQSVPAGDYAMQTLRTLDLADGLKDRLELGANVRQVLNYVERGEVDAGIVYRTDALSSPGKVRIVATADETTHKPIVYPAAVIFSSRHHDEALKFLDFLGTPDGMARLTRYGFLPPESKH